VDASALLLRFAQWSVLVYVAIGILAFLEASAFVGLLAPGEAAVILGGALASRAGLSPVAVAGAAALGAALGDTVGYELGHRLGRPWVERRARPGSFRCRQLARAERLFAEHGGKTVFFGRFVGFLRAFAPFVAGMSRMPYGRFVAFNVSGAVLWAVACTAAGYFAGESWTRIHRWVGWGALAAALAAVLVVLALRRRAPA
jgi:undecaprenyl-diphosphatase